MSAAPHAQHSTAPASRQPHTIRSRGAACLGALCGCLLVAALGLSGAALADSMSLSIAPEPVEELTSQITWTANSEQDTFTVVAVNNPGVPCAATPKADNGTTVTPGHLLEPGNSGAYTGTANYTPPSTGAYTVCGWLELPAGLLETDGGPVTAATSLPLDVRLPHISLSLSFPRRPAPGKRFTLDLLSSSEVEREVVVEGIPYTHRGCPVNYAAESTQHLIDANVTGGPWRSAVNVSPLRAGARYIFCAWADPPSDSGLYPEATTSLILDLAHRRQHGRRLARP
jgi:hypothetical protein